MKNENWTHRLTLLIIGASIAYPIIWYHVSIDRRDPYSAQLLWYLVVGIVGMAVVALVKEIGILPRWENLLTFVKWIFPPFLIMTGLVITAPWRYDQLSADDIALVWIAVAGFLLFGGLAIRELRTHTSRCKDKERQ